MSDIKVNEIKTDTIKNKAGTSAATIDSTGIMTGAYLKPTSEAKDIYIIQNLFKRKIKYSNA